MESKNDETGIIHQIFDNFVLLTQPALKEELRLQDMPNIYKKFIENIWPIVLNAKFIEKLEISDKIKNYKQNMFFLQFNMDGYNQLYKSVIDYVNNQDKTSLIEKISIFKYYAMMFSVIVLFVDMQQSILYIFWMILFSTHPRGQQILDRAKSHKIIGSLHHL
ncbi:hypothetical protein PPERSA_00064 [Pseudocohnilembus persalinus]|uniref:Uncharacterized protein n=1 Tax=Pseudocohnilembus persalinus TaxID=266149 RepID=A0A0V0QY42_PSEPJ|nr:hypothetical protein PPERSA_00064 [Pseudocohnilembus persalinus]|eukprot:KRX07154.1 hypothetical protein PPERSA_00064 [Pseudocohnilembus persalinus]